jgi:P4 family phage/plasmid primase-like protien
MNTHRLVGLRPKVTRDSRKRKYINAFLRPQILIENVTEAFTFFAKDGLGRRCVAEGLLAKEVFENPYDLHWTIYRTQKYPDLFGFSSMDLIPFDLDGVGDKSLADAVISIFCETLNLDPQKTPTLWSGHGLHFYVLLPRAYTDPNFISDTQPLYKKLCSRVDQALKDAGVPGHLDTNVFRPCGRMRLPGSINKKFSKKDNDYFDEAIRTVILQKEVGPQDLFGEDFGQESWQPPNPEPDTPRTQHQEYTPPQDHISEKALKHFPPPDTDSVLSECLFLQDRCKGEASKLTEPEWYAMLGLLGRLPEGNKLAHEYSSLDVERYSEHETEEKLNQAITRAGPRFCKSINDLWAGCRDCKYLNDPQVPTPLQIQGPDYIRTKDTGFYDVVLDGSGKVKTRRPNYPDLAKYFAKLHPFKTMADRGEVWIYNGLFWEPRTNTEIEAFAQTHFNPPPNNNQLREFRGKIQTTNVVKREDFHGTTNGMINLQNGVLDVKKRVLVKHSPEYGFKGVLPYSYDPLAECPRFDTFLETVTLGRKDLKQLLLEYAGYAVSGEPYRFQKALFLSGDGSNGKSTFLQVLKALVGDGLYSSVSISKFSDANAILDLEGKLFNVSDEAHVGALYKSDSFKLLVGGEEVQVRKLYVGHYKMKNRAKIIVACNEVPYTQDLTGGFKRRMLIVPFDATFDAKGEKGDKPDTRIKEKLLAELPGIFNRVMEGYDCLIKQGGFSESVTAEKILQGYLESNDLISDWVDECGVEITGIKDDFVPTVELFEHFKQHALDSSTSRTDIRKGRFIKQLLTKYKQVDSGRDFIQGRHRRTVRGIKVPGRGAQPF